MVVAKESYDLPYNQVYMACKRASRNLGWRITEFDKEEGYIEAKASVSLLSWGESIEINVWEDEDETLVEVESRPTAQLFDWGKNNENLDNFFEELEDILGV